MLRGKNAHYLPKSNPYPLTHDARRRLINTNKRMECNRFLVAILFLLAVMAASVALAILFPYETVDTQPSPGQSYDGSASSPFDGSIFDVVALDPDFSTLGAYP